MLAGILVAFLSATSPLRFVVGLLERCFQFRHGLWVLSNGPIGIARNVAQVFYEDKGIMSPARQTLMILDRERATPYNEGKADLALPGGES